MRSVLCICDLIPRLETRTRLTVLMHWREAKSTSNSGRLAALSLPNSEVLVRGSVAHEKFDASGVLRPEYQAVVLFPREGAVELTPALAASYGKPVHLIVPDGTWRQARKSCQRVPEFADLPCVKLGPGAPSAYELRKHVNEANISTFEAIARALEILEPDGAEVRRRLEALFAVMVERVLWSRGKLKLAELKHGAPEAALAEFRERGRQSGPAGSKRKLAVD
jgi:DTW domain-containing protein YfiP